MTNNKYYLEWLSVRVSPVNRDHGGAVIERRVYNGLDQTKVVTFTCQLCQLVILLPCLCGVGSK